MLERCEGRRYGDIAVSALSFAELSYMVANSAQAERKRASIARFLLAFPILPFDEAAGEAFAKVRLAVRNARIGVVDELIAAHALSVGAAVVTGNVRHFSRVPGLVVEDWIGRSGRSQ